MNKTQKMKTATRNNKKRNFVATMKKIIAFPWHVCKAVWRWVVRVCRAIWNWLKNINIIGMINLTLSVAIIVLLYCLVSNVLNNKSSKVNHGHDNVVVTNAKYKVLNNKRNVVNSKFNTVLPVKVNAKTGITPKIKVVGVDKPVVIAAVSESEKELPAQKLYGDVIVDMVPSSPVLMNGVTVQGNLYVQNMRKYTLPCGMKITGHLFIRNVERLSFCGPFSVRGNIYVNRQSSFGPIPENSRVGGQIIL